MDGDGLVDSVSARATVPTFGSPKGELVWFKQPASNALGQTWAETVIGNGPDVMIHVFIFFPRIFLIPLFLISTFIDS